MKGFKILLFMFSIILISYSLTFADEGKETRIEWINPEQAISVGEAICESTFGIGNYYLTYKYFYLGIENNSLKIEFLHETNDSSEKTILSLPLNANNQALLKAVTTQHGKADWELVITVVDDFYRIKVKELKE